MYAVCERITLVLDNHNTHMKVGCYTAFGASWARDLVRRIEFWHTPKHSSQPNITENESSAPTRQWLGGRRVGDIGTLGDATAIWSVDVTTCRGVGWRMKIDDARRRLKSVYAKIKL